LSLTPTTPSFKSVAKSFWDRPEGTASKLFLAAAGIGLAGVVIFFWGLILPFLIGVAGNTLQLALLVGLLGAITSPIWSSRIRLLTRNCFQLSMRWATSLIIETDPIGMLRNNVDTLRKKLTEVLDPAVSQLSGSVQRLKSEIAKNQQDAVHQKALADEVARQIVQLQRQLQQVQDPIARQAIGLKIQGFQLQQQGYMENAGMLLQTNNQEQPLLDQTVRMYGQMCRIQQLASFKVDSLSQQADMWSKRRATILASQKALGAANSILKGDSQQLAIVDQTLEFLNNEADDTIGAMDDFNRWSDKYLTDMDIQKGAAADEATQMFANLEKKLIPAGTADTLIPTLPTIDAHPDNAGVYTTSALPETDYTKYLK
jgi:hypothetical protein